MNKERSITSVKDGREIYWNDTMEVWKYSDTDETLENWKNLD